MQIRTIHRLKPSDRLEDLSARYRVPVCMIMRANSLLQPNSLLQHRELKIPCICYCNRYEKEEPAQYAFYTVQPGDTLFGIARSHGVTMKLLQKANGLQDPDALHEGQRLKIPRLSGEVHYVRQGETLEDIALRSGICASRIRETNGLEPGEAVYPGMRLVLG